MAGPTVASRATKTVLARLGRKNVHRENARSGDEGTRGASPLTAVWAIVQAYAIVALVLTAYNSVFASDAGVPDAVQVRAAPQRLVQAGVDEAQRHAQHEVRREAQEVGAQDVARRRAELDLARHDELGPGLAADVQFVDRVLDGRAPRPQLAAQRPVSYTHLTLPTKA